MNWTGYVYGGLAHSSHIKYDEESEKKGEASVRRGLKRIGLTPTDLAGRRVLDVGTGLYGFGFNRLGALVDHFDVSTATVQAINDYSGKNGYANLHSKRVDLVSEELPTEQFDLIYLSGVYQHFEEPSRALLNLSRSLKVGGHFYIDIYRSGRWRWFVVDVLRQITDKSLMYDVLSRFTEFCALSDVDGFHLRQVELLIDDVFVENVHLFHPDDLKADAELLGLELAGPSTSMDLVDTGDIADHSLFFAHVFDTLIFRKGRPTTASEAPANTVVGRSQIAEMEAMPDSYRDAASLAAEFILAHRAGKFARPQVVSHIMNLFRMAHPCLPGDPYLVPGKREPAESDRVCGDAQTLALRHSLWCTFLANTLNVQNPLEKFQLQSLGYELVRFLPNDHHGSLEY